LCKQFNKGNLQHVYKGEEEVDKDPKSSILLIKSTSKKEASIAINKDQANAINMQRKESYVYKNNHERRMEKRS
jgi:hypothetical protein